MSDNQLCDHWETPDFSGFKALISAIKQHELLTVEAVDMGELLDVSGQNVGPDGAKLMATFIKNNGALEKLTMSNNSIKCEGTKVLTEALRVSMQRMLAFYDDTVLCLMIYLCV